MPVRIVWGAALVGLAVWSLAAWVGYVSVEALTTWLTANAGAAMGSGRNLAAASGVGQEALGALDSLNAPGLLNDAMALSRSLLKPAIVIIWGVGALALILAPLIVGKIGKRLAGTGR